MAKGIKALEPPLSSSGSEYSLSESHSNVGSELAGSKRNTVREEAYTVTARKRVEVTVAVEFPVEANEKAEYEFNELLKAIWLKKIEIGSRQI